jgi:hypothetical protein
LAQIVIAYTLLGIPIRLGCVLGSVVVISIVCLAIDLRRKAEAGPTLFDTEPQDISKPFVVLAAGLTGLALLGILVRTTLYPLSGPDPVFRWDALPRLMLEYQNLSYYPPTTADDFSKYMYPDSFPPLVATVYWWLYAAWGSACPRLTSVAVFLQASSCFALVFYAARLLFGTSGAVLSLIVLSSTALFLTGIANGQENGYSALSFAGQLSFALAATREPRARFIVIAGLFAGLGALAREYGPLLSLCGLSVLASRRQTLRFIPLFCLMAAVCGGPWLIRNWVIAGNPLYSWDLGMGLSVNRVHAGIISVCHEFLGLHNHTLEIWGIVVKAWLIGAPLALFVGVPGIIAAGKNGIALGASAALAFLLWILSLPNTEGGVLYTWRILTPAWVTLSIAAGAFGYVLLRTTNPWRKYLQVGTALATVICGGYALVCCWAQPLEARDIGRAIFSMRKDPLDSYMAQLWIAKTLDESNLPPVGVLTEDCNLAVALQRCSRFRPVMIWNPEVLFIFNPAQEASAVRRQLIDKNIWLVAVTYRSLNNNYLSKFPFYAELFQNSKPIVDVPESQSIIFLPKLAQPDFETVTPGK